ncbi:hypothetical protein NDU88_000859 [Pleurodeles waltl]|uniref:Uncharacterized protein n=1 Tax=Pleurodeles waltl TaxID=8319 RepID=A0AAV7MJA9_PLEWA|nr:hypothetical protein NDU88_000859 [Pleurodeles waltl]
MCFRGRNNTSLSLASENDLKLTCDWSYSELQVDVRAGQRVAYQGEISGALEDRGDKENLSHAGVTRNSLPQSAEERREEGGRNWTNA